MMPLAFIRHKSATVLLTVIIMTMVLSVIVVSIMSMSVGQVKSSQSVIDDIKAEYLGQAYFQRYHAEKTLTGSSTLPTSVDTVLDGKNFESTGTSTATIPNPQINAIDINIDFLL